MSFDKLLEELETLQKAQSADLADEDKIQAAAADGNPDADNDGLNDVTGEPVEAGGDADGGEDDDRTKEEKGSDIEPMGKSFTLKLDDGTEMEAVDGTELVKSLMARVENHESQMAKALEGALGLLKSQGEMIKSLRDQVAKLSNSGRGRKTVVSVAEKQPASEMLKKSEEGVPAGEFLAKALSAQAEGKITGLDVARIEALLNRGEQVPPDIVRRVMQ